MNANLILNASAQCYDAWCTANSNPVEFTRIDISEYYLYARINGQWVYEPSKVRGIGNGKAELRNLAH